MADEQPSQQPVNPLALPAAPVSPPARPAATVYLYSEPHARFDLSGMDLPDLTPEGTSYTPQQADIVRTLCRKYRVRYFEEAP